MPKFFILLLFIFVLDVQAYTIIVDPGHGGSDQGAIAPFEKKNSKGERYITYIYEKDLALKLARKIALRLKKKRYKVFLTRSFDRITTLEERAKLAETVRADLFISIHFNSSTIKSSAGFESYYLDNHDDAAVVKVEREENKSLEGQDLVAHQILTDLVIKKTAKTSRRLAQSIHGQIKKRLVSYKMNDREVRPGLFYVLALSKIPGVLLEAGFMSNKKELKLITSEKFQIQYANGVVAGIDKYLVKLNKIKPRLF